MTTNLLVAQEDLATQEIFGSDVRKEIIKAQQALSDFAKYYVEIKRDYKIIAAELNACTKKGQASQIMSRVRQTYM